VKHKAAHRRLVEFKYRAFRGFVSMPLHEFDQRLNGARFPCVQFATRTSHVFSEWHSRFYQSGKKIVPRDIADLLVPLSLAVWFMDDGAADHAGVTFQTHSFSLDEVNLLIDALNGKFRLAASLRRNRGHHVIYVGASSLEKLEQIVQPHLLLEMRYKLGAHRSRTP
jgi:hypothetical protein